MNVLVVADAFPMPDRTSADFRLTELLSMIAQEHHVFFFAISAQNQIAALGKDEVARYREMLAKRGITAVEGSIKGALKAREYAVVMFEWYFTARYLLAEIRARQPRARVIVDTVDVVFNRLEAKARLTQARSDIAKAAETKVAELAVYANADIVITVTDADAAILHREGSDVVTFTIPNIHPRQDLPPPPPENEKRLVFIGSFSHEPNVDAMRYFCRDVLPLIVAVEPEVRLRIIGNGPTPEITALASDHVEVLGFVPDTRPFLESSAISIAPLRFGGGMKGKIGEAMSHALPVVTTSTGIEGFGLQPGRDALVGDDARTFAASVTHLLRDREYREQIRMAGYRFMREHYSDIAARERVRTLLVNLEGYPIRQMPPSQRWLFGVKDAWDQHLGWRLR